MTMYSLAKKNIKSNLQQYILYLYSMVFSIVIFYTFTSLKNNQQLMESTTTLGKIQPAFSVGSFILMIFAAVFILYSNAFFTRKRKKEVGLYALVGMTKKQIGRLLFYENMVIGLLALIIGIILGTILSRLFVMIIIKLMGFSVVADFTISTKSIMHTFIVFFIIILITSVKSYRLIYRFTLVQLFKAEKIGEKPPKSSNYKTILSLIMLGGGYTILLQPISSALWNLGGPKWILVSVIMIIAGTYFFLNSTVVYILKRIRRNKNYFYNSINLISITHLLYRIKSNVVTLTVISLLTTCTLFFLSTTYSFYSNATKLTAKVNPYSYMYSSIGEEKDQKIRDIINQADNHPLIYDLRIEYLEIPNVLTQFQGFIRPEAPLNLISENTYKEIQKKIGIKAKGTTGKDHAIAFYSGSLNANSDPFTGKTIELSPDHQLTITEYEPFTITNSRLDALPLIISDTLYSELKQSFEQKYYQVYKVGDEKHSGKLSTKIKEILYEGEPVINDINYMAFYDEYHYFMQTYGILIFIGSFLGIVFILATGSTIYFKQVTEALSDKGRYRALTRIGMSQSEIKKSIAKQNLFIFLLPLIVAVSHSTIILLAISNYLSMNLVIPSLVCLTMYFIIYLIYYLFTNIKYKQIVD